MSRVISSLVVLLAALVAAFSILFAAWMFSYPGRVYMCELGLQHYADKQPKLARHYCLNNVEVNL